jgi:hypothetical protein
VTCIVLIDSLGLVVCSCSDRLVYVLETRIGSVTLAAKAKKLDSRHNRSTASLGSAGPKPEPRTLLHFHGQRDVLISLDRRSDLKVWDPTKVQKG